MKIKTNVVGTEYEIEIHNHAVTKTKTGMAGYFEATLPNGTKIKCIGIYDDAYADFEEGECAQFCEQVYVDGTYVKCEEEDGLRIEIGDGESVRCEEIMGDI